MKTVAITALTVTISLNAFAGAQAGGLAETTTHFRPYDELPLVDMSEREKQALGWDDTRRLMTTLIYSVDGTLERQPPSRREIGSLMRQLRTGLRTRAGLEAYAVRDKATSGFDPNRRRRADGAEVHEADALRPETVIGDDGRQQILDTTPYPYSAVGLLLFDQGGCTGTLIGPRQVLTAAHCVYDTGTDSWYQGLVFAPAQNGEVSPYGVYNVVQAFITEGWAVDHLREHDIALVTLDQDVGEQVGWMGFASIDLQARFPGVINGYPGDKDFGTMWYSLCEVALVQPERFYYDCDTAGGMSGSGVHEVIDEQLKVYGVHVNGVDDSGLNSATRIHPAFFEMLLDWWNQA